jgi:hypothetical protein
MTDVEAIERVMTLLADAYAAQRWAATKTKNEDAEWLFRGIADEHERTFRQLDSLRWGLSRCTTPHPGTTSIVNWGRT